jgi:hypothetical protein
MSIKNAELFSMSIQNLRKLKLKIQLFESFNYSIWFDTKNVELTLEFSGLYYKHITVVNYDSSIVNKCVASLSDNARVVIYDRHMFIVQATVQIIELVACFRNLNWFCKKKIIWKKSICQKKTQNSETFSSSTQHRDNSSLLKWDSFQKKFELVRDNYFIIADKFFMFSQKEIVTN